MSGFELPTKPLLTENCDAVENILEMLHDRTDKTLAHCSRMLSPVKAMFTALQSLEDDASKPDGAFYTADARARHNLAGILTGCGVTARRLRQRISSNALRRDDPLGIELISLTTDINEYLKLHKKNSVTSGRSRQGGASDSSALVEDLLRKQQKHQSEVEGLGRHPILALLII
jgi:hypothetical protein